MQYVEDQISPIDSEQRDDEPPKMWHAMDEQRGDGNWTLCGIWLDPNASKRSIVGAGEVECVVCEDLRHWRKRSGL